MREHLWWLFFGVMIALLLWAGTTDKREGTTHEPRPTFTTSTR